MSASPSHCRRRRPPSFFVRLNRALAVLFVSCCFPQDLVRTRQYITKFIEMRSHLQGVALKLQTVKSHQAMAEAMQSTAVAMQKMNKAVNVSTITKMLAEFERENQKTEMMQEGTVLLLLVRRPECHLIRVLFLTIASLLVRRSCPLL